MSVKDCTASELCRAFRACPINVNARHEWSEYREKVTDYIIGHCEKNRTLIVYGAGRCDDLNIERLADWFSQITLVDVADFVHESLPSNVNELRFDLTGMDASVLEQYADYLLETFQRGQAAGAVEHLIAGLSERVTAVFEEDYHPKGIVPLLGEQYDYSVALGLHSQLNNVFSGFTEFVLGRLGADRTLHKLAVEQLEKLQSRYTGVIVRTADDIILDATGRGVILGIEYEARCHDAVFSYIDGAKQCAEDFEQLQREGIVRALDVTHMDWNVDTARGLSYDMLIGMFDIISK